MKRIIIILLLTITMLMGIMLPVVQADNTQITVTINNQQIQFDQPPIIIDGRTLVPLRAIFEGLGATVDWNGNTQTVTAKRENTTVKITIGDNKLYVNGNTVNLDVPAQIISDRTLVPVRAVSEAFDCKVDWDSNKHNVSISNTSYTNNDSVTKPQKYIYNRYATLFDLSGINWYLTQKYGFDEPDNCFYFEFQDEEAALIFAQRLNAKDATDEVVVFAFNADLGDWYKYNSDVFAPYNKAIAGNAENGDVIKRFDYGTPSNSATIYFQFDKSTGYISKIYEVGVGNYGSPGSGYIAEMKDGKIVTTYRIPNREYYDFFFGTYSFEKLREESEDYWESQYRYNDDGTLNSYSEYAYWKGEIFECRSYSMKYSDSQRQFVYDNSWGVANNGILEYKRDSNGNVKTATYNSYEKNYTNEFIIKYNPDGTVEYN